MCVSHDQESPRELLMSLGPHRVDDRAPREAGGGGGRRQGLLRHGDVEEQGEAGGPHGEVRQVAGPTACKPIKGKRYY